MLQSIFHFVYTHVPPWAYIAVISHLTILGTVAYLILLERKVASWVQDRIGPNRVGLDFGILPFKFLKRMFGFGQPLADGLKFIMKEDYKPKGVDTVLFTIAPGLMIIVIIISIAVLPWGGVMRTTRDVDVTGTTAATGREALSDNLPPGVDLLDVKPQQYGTFAVLGQTPKVGGNYYPPGTKVVVTYDQTNAAGQIRRSTRFVDVSGATEKSDAEAVLARLPAGAQIAHSGEQVTVDVPIHLVKNADGTFTELARNASYQWDFAPGRLNIGVLYILAVLSLAVYGVVIGGWASNNKFSFLGGLRATANMISYEIPLGLAILCVVLMYGTLDLSVMVDRQAGYWLGVIPAWNVFTQPLAFVLFIICIHAEANRAPFDTAEAEQELVGGYHTEYSAMRFALFFLAEYAGMITTSAVCVAMFFGGWHLPYVEYLWPALRGVIDPNSPSVTDSLIACLIRAGVFFTKTVGIIFIFMWVRWSLPRFRFDQIMILAWRAMIPISLALLVGTALAIYFTAGPMGPDGQVPRILPVGEALAMLVTNIVVLVLTMLVSKVLPAPAATNRRLPLPRSRYQNTPLPGKPVLLADPALVS
jgi:NADH:ubiquinone oxidoreductase subunit H